jgi:hypothetical protein
MTNMNCCAASRNQKDLTTDSTDSTDKKGLFFHPCYPCYPWLKIFHELVDTYQSQSALITRKPDHPAFPISLSVLRRNWPQAASISPPFSRRKVAGTL